MQIVETQQQPDSDSEAGQAAKGAAETPAESSPLQQWGWLSMSQPSPSPAIANATDSSPIPALALGDADSHRRGPNYCNEKSDRRTDFEIVFGAIGPGQTIRGSGRWGEAQAGARGPAGGAPAEPRPRRWRSAWGSLEVTPSKRPWLSNPNRNRFLSLACLRLLVSM